ncbi:MAG: pentapeptide repeat-containing protein [Betaproteobacteria bacterium]|nr:pentapeptide repeat-containing protein [Betaproteobacteria bacterium]
MRTPSSLIRLVAILGLVTLAVPAAWCACPTVGPGPTYTLSIPPPYAGVNWSGCNLTNANMSGFDFSLANLSFTTLTNANPSGPYAT